MASACASTASRTGLPVWITRASSGTAVGQTPQATALTREAKMRLTRPSTPFCSWISRGSRRIDAAIIAGSAG